MATKPCVVCGQPHNYRVFRVKDFFVYWLCDNPVCADYFDGQLDLFCEHDFVDISDYLAAAIASV